MKAMTQFSLPADMAQCMISQEMQTSRISWHTLKMMAESSAVCHGPAAFADAKTKDGKYLVDGIKLTGFTNVEEKAMNLTEDMPFLLQSKLEENGAGFVEGRKMEENVVSSGNFITGQNPASAQGVAEAVINRLK